MYQPTAVGASHASDVLGADRVYPDGSFLFHCHLFGYQDFASRIPEGGRVLDLACGEGYGSAVIAGRTGRCVGLDLAPSLLAASSKQYPDVDFVTGDALRLPFADGSFDAVGALQVIEHLTETEAFLSEIARVLKPGGFAYITTPNIDRHPRMARKEFNPHHLRDFTPSELRSELSKVFGEVRLFGQMLDPSLPRAQVLLAAAEREWELIPRAERVELLVRRFPGPVRVRLRRWLLRLAGISAWPLPEAETARNAIRAEDFRRTEPVEESGNMIAVVSEPLARSDGRYALA